MQLQVIVALKMPHKAAAIVVMGTESSDLK
jgi:hypothetical protein